MGNMTPSNGGTVCIFNDPKVGEQFTSFSPADMAGKLKLYNAINSPDARLADFINTPIVIRDVVVSKVELVDKVNPAADNWDSEGTTRIGFRVVVIDMEDKSYTATSTGIYNSICTMRSIFGTLHFEEGLTAVVKQVKTKNGNSLTLALTE